MSNILISGLVNTETTVRVGGFPIEYFPIDYPFFGVNTAVSGVAYNIVRALDTLGDGVKLTSMTGDDFAGSYIRAELSDCGINTDHIRRCLRQTPSSVVLYEESGRRQIYCDLKDIQETAYDFPADICHGIDLVAACNINFNRPLLRLVREVGIPIATDVHVFSNIHDDYNRDFLECAQIVFLSDEGIWGDWRDFIRQLAYTYGTKIVVLGRGSQGAAMYLREEDWLVELPAVRVGEVVNTVGAGDALFSGFIHYYAKGFHPVEALKRAEIFASAKIGTSGSAKGFITETQIEELYRTVF